MSCISYIVSTKYRKRLELSLRIFFPTVSLRCFLRFFVLRIYQIYFYTLSCFLRLLLPTEVFQNKWISLSRRYCTASLKVLVYRCHTWPFITPRAIWRIECFPWFSPVHVVPYCSLMIGEQRRSFHSLCLVQLFYSPKRPLEISL